MASGEVIDYLTNRVTVLLGKDDTSFISKADGGNCFYRAGQIKIWTLDTVVLQGIENYLGIRIIEEDL
jgi:hypothetical protein